MYDIPLDHTPIQIKTDSEVGTDDAIWMRFIERVTTDHGPGLEIHFTDPPVYILEYCTGFVEFSMCPGPERVWTISKENQRIKLECNDEVLFDINYHDNNYLTDGLPKCMSYWGMMHFGSTKFQGSAADYYRQKPGKFL